MEFEVIIEGYCETCKHKETCTKDIGFIWGFCETGYEPIEKENEKE